MPRINEYGAPEVEGQIPIEPSGRNIEAAGGLGRAVQRFGSMVGDLSDSAYHQQVQEESSDLRANLATAGADFSDRIQQQTQEGKVDAEGLKTEYAEYVDSISDNYQTPGGRRLLKQESARVGAIITKSAIHAQAVVAGEAEKRKLETAARADSVVIENAPENHLAIYNKAMASIDKQVEEGGLKANLADKLKQEVGVRYAKAAVNGWAKSDPKLAERILEHGTFDSFFDAEEKKQMRGVIHEYSRAKESDLALQERLEKRVRDKRDEKWKVDNADKVEKGGVTHASLIAELKAGNLSYEAYKEQRGVLDHVLKENAKPNYALRNELGSRITADENDDSKIRSISQIDAYVASGQLDIESRGKLVRLFKDTQGNKTMLGARKALTREAEKVLAGRDDMMNMKDPNGAEKLAKFNEMLEGEEERYRNENKPMRELYDSMYQTINQMKATPKDVIAARTQTMRAQNRAKKAIEGADPAKATVQWEKGDTAESWMKKRKDAADAGKAAASKTPPPPKSAAEKSADAEGAAFLNFLVGPPGDDEALQRNRDRMKNK